MRASGLAGLLVAIFIGWAIYHYLLAPAIAGNTVGEPSLRGSSGEVSGSTAAPDREDFVRGGLPTTADLPGTREAPPVPFTAPLPPPPPVVFNGDPDCGPPSKHYKHRLGKALWRCRPSFLIIGAAKSGTSALYAYLTAHPRVEPAAKKQIQFFDHGWPKGEGADVTNRLENYYINSFSSQLGTGMITGESSPGYMVYPQVPTRIFQSLPTIRILAVVRDPAERAFSSYKYNYLRNLQPGAMPIPFGLMVRWEIDRVLEPCFAAAPDPLSIDLTQDCYNQYGLKTQFAEIITISNRKWNASSLPMRQLIVYRGMVGRGLYSVMLEHYYRVFAAWQMKVVCTETLDGAEAAADSMNAVAEWLQLPKFDFHNVTAKGKYNTGANTGYDVTTPWGDEVKPGGGDGGEQGHMLADSLLQMQGAALDTPTRHALEHFFHKYNQRLKQLSGVSCEWMKAPPADEPVAVEMPEQAPPTPPPAPPATVTDGSDGRVWPTGRL